MKIVDFFKGFASWKAPEASGNCYLKGALAPSQNDCLMLSASQESVSYTHLTLPTIYSV